MSVKPERFRDDGHMTVSDSAGQLAFEPHRRAFTMTSVVEPPSDRPSRKGAFSATGQGTSSHHRDRWTRAGEPRLLRRRARHASGQAQHQPGRPGHLSPLLRRRRRASRHRSHVLSRGHSSPRPGWDTDSPSKSHWRCPRKSSVVARAPREIWRGDGARRDSDSATPSCR